MTDEELDRMLGISQAREKAERQVAEIIREAEDEGTTLLLEVKRLAGRWIVRLDNPGDGVGAAVGEGDTFAEAWHRLTPGWAPQNDNAGGR